jgi:hypothetical protein
MKIAEEIQWMRVAADFLKNPAVIFDEFTRVCTKCTSPSSWCKELSLFKKPYMRHIISGALYRNAPLGIKTEGTDRCRNYYHIFYGSGKEYRNFETNMDRIWCGHAQQTDDYQNQEMPWIMQKTSSNSSTCFHLYHDSSV